MAKKSAQESDEQRLKTRVAARWKAVEVPSGDPVLRALRKRLKRTQRKRRALAQRKARAAGASASGQGEATSG